MVQSTGSPALASELMEFFYELIWKNEILNKETLPARILRQEKYPRDRRGIDAG